MCFQMKLYWNKWQNYCYSFWWNNMFHLYYQANKCYLFNYCIYTYYFQIYTYIFSTFILPSVITEEVVGYNLVNQERGEKPKHSFHNPKIHAFIFLSLMMYFKRQLKCSQKFLLILLCIYNKHFIQFSPF